LAAKETKDTGQDETDAGDLLSEVFLESLD
jgi:hypothetical protein